MVVEDKASFVEISVCFVRNDSTRIRLLINGFIKLVLLVLIFRYETLVPIISITDLVELVR